jgi:hypothetical protein
VHPFTDLKNRISAARSFCMPLFLIVQHSLRCSSRMLTFWTLKRCHFKK